MGDWKLLLNSFFLEFIISPTKSLIGLDFQNPRKKLKLVILESTRRRYGTQGFSLRHHSSRGFAQFLQTKILAYTVNTFILGDYSSSLSTSHLVI
jgi:hypothetical protein